MHGDTMKISMRRPHDVLTLAPVVQTMAVAAYQKTQGQVCKCGMAPLDRVLISVRFGMLKLFISFRI